MSDRSQQSGPIYWLIQNWPKTTPFLATISIVVITVYLYEDNFLLFLLWLQTPIYFLHQFEEYIYPGGFAKFCWGIEGWM